MWDLQVVNDINQVAAKLIEDGKQQRAALEVIAHNGLTPRYMNKTKIRDCECNSIGRVSAFHAEC